jgi:hypothetical protein
MERRLTRFAAPVSLFIRENADNKLAPNAALLSAVALSWVLP